MKGIKDLPRLWCQQQKFQHIPVVLTNQDYLEMGLMPASYLMQALYIVGNE